MLFWKQENVRVVLARANVIRRNGSLILKDGNTEA